MSKPKNKKRDWPEPVDWFDASHDLCDNCRKNIADVDQTIESNADRSIEYAFCDEACRDEFAKKHGLLYDELHACFDFDPDFVEPETAADNQPATDEVEVEHTQDDTPEDTQEDTQDKDEAPDESENDCPSINNENALKILQQIIDNNREVNEANIRVESLQRQLKSAKADLEELREKSERYIRTNSHDYQFDIFDVQTDDNPPDTETPPKTSEGKDPNGWKSCPCSVLEGFTEKQMEKIELQFSTLGEVQDWACYDYREKKPGIGAKLQDALIEAMDKFADQWRSGCEPETEPEPETELEPETESETDSESESESETIVDTQEKSNPKGENENVEVFSQRA